MKTATYKAEILSADFEENTITFLIDGDFKVRAGKYFIFSKEDLQNFAGMICEKQRENCCAEFEESRKEYQDFDNDDIQESYYQISNAEQPKIEEL